MKKMIFTIRQCIFSQFRNYHLLEKGVAFHLTKLECPSPKDALLQVWLKFDEWFWRRRFLNFVNVFLLFVIISPQKKFGPFIWRNLNPLHPRMLCAKFGWNWPSGSWEEVEKWKVYRQTDGQRDGQTDRRRMTGAWALSSGELKKTDVPCFRYTKKPHKICIPSPAVHLSIYF